MLKLFTTEGPSLFKSLFVAKILQHVNEQEAYYLIKTLCAAWKNGTIEFEL